MNDGYKLMMKERDDMRGIKMKYCENTRRQIQEVLIKSV